VLFRSDKPIPPDFVERWTAVKAHMSKILIQHQGRSLDDDRDFKAVLLAMTKGAIELIDLDRKSRS